METNRYNVETLPTSAKTEAKPRKTYRKPWSKSISQANFATEKMKNANVEAHYHRVVKLVKTLYLKQGDRYFERDYKHDPEAYLSMHCFLTPSFYLTLDCPLDLVYRVEWAFNNNPFESEITKLLNDYSMQGRAKQVILQPDFSTFYQRTLALQDGRYVYCFKS